MNTRYRYFRVTKDTPNPTHDGRNKNSVKIYKEGTSVYARIGTAEWRSGFLPVCFAYHESQPCHSMDTDIQTSIVKGECGWLEEREPTPREWAKREAYLEDLVERLVESGKVTLAELVELNNKEG